MQTKRIHYGFAAVSFLVALYTYTATMQPSIPFWDCGEFAAAARSLSIPHPPGAPLWTLVGRIALLLPTFTDPVARYNFFSVLSSAVSVMLLYLIIVRLIKMWRGAPQTTADIITHYGAALIGALSYCFTDSFWFNALECEVYAFGSLFVSLIPWLILVWYDHADEEHSEKWLLLIFYVIGLSMGVHQLALLTIFPVFMLVYYKHWRGKSEHNIWGRSLGMWLTMALITTVAFGVAFLVILSDIVTWLGNAGFSRIAAILLLIAMPAGIYWSQKNNKAVWNIAIWAATFLFLGFTTYFSLLVRAGQDPPMNQHHVSNFKALHQFIDREQYGQVTLTDEFMHRRLEQQKEDHARTWDESIYKSDGDFFWKYQTDHMFLRYWEWNFIGRQNDKQDAGVDWTKTWGIPILLGLVGLFWHFKRDPKRAFAVLAMFIIMGFVTAWYQNQQDPQPRERDYFYVGAFYAYAMWIGIGAAAIMELIRAWYAKKQALPMQEAGPLDREVHDPEGEKTPTLRGNGPVGVLAGVCVLLLILVPLNQCIGLVGQLAYGQSFKQASKWGEYSRKHNNVPLEYAYDVLQSCDQDGILFTAGDNDTFPLWALQDVYGVRTDVRIVNLSLGNMGWYIKQLKDQHVWGAKTINLPSFTEEMLNNEDETPQGVHTQPFAQMGEPPMDPPILSVNVKGSTMARFGKPDQPGMMQWKYTSQHAFQGKYYYAVADQLVRDIVQYNIDDRPIYFALGVPPSYWNGLDDYVVFTGLAARVEPVAHPGSKNGLEGDIDEGEYKAIAYNLSPTLNPKPSHAALMNSFRDPEANRSDLDDRTGWETGFQVYGRLANYYLKRGNTQEANRALDTLTARIPPTSVAYDPGVLQELARLYKNAGNTAMSSKYSKWTLDALKTSDMGKDASADPNAAIQRQFAVAQLSYAAGDLPTAKTSFLQLQQQFPAGDVNREFIDFYLMAIDGKQMEAKGDKKGAVAKFTLIINAYISKSQQAYGQELQDLMLERATLMKQLGMPDSGRAPEPPTPQTKDAIQQPAKPQTSKPQ